MSEPSELHKLENEKRSYSLEVSVDRDGFFRRTCPSCGRDFKTLASDADFTSILNPQIERLGSQFGLPLSIEGANIEKTYLRCPYCGDTAESGKTLTEEMITYAKRFVMREFVWPMINQMFGDLEDSFRGNRSSGGFLSISVEFQHSRGVLAIRPMNGPEPADMKIITLLCCDKKIKISEQWTGFEACPYCESDIVIL